MSEENQDLSEEEKQSKKQFEELEAYVTRHEDRTVTLELEEPIEYTVGSVKKTLDKLVFRRTKGRDWVATDKSKGEMGKTTSLAASITGVPMAAIEDLFQEDFLRCMLVTGTMGKSPTAGKTSSET